MTRQTKPPLRSYQQEGVDFLVAHPRALLLDDPGLGKSRQVIEAWRELYLSREGHGVLVFIGPPSAVVSFKEQLALWAPQGVRVFEPNGKGELELKGVGVSSARAISSIGYMTAVLLTYDALAIRANKALRSDLECLFALSINPILVLDEAHYLKSLAANRTKAIYGSVREEDGVVRRFGLADKAARVWAMSGTLMQNHAGELYPHARFLLNTTTQSPETWENAYCHVKNGAYGRTITGSKNLRKMRETHFDGHFLRRRKSEVLHDLPPLDIVDQPIPVEKLDRKIFENMEAFELAARAGDDELLGMLNDSNLHLASQRRMLGMAKAGPAAQWARDFLEGSNKKLILFAHHRAVIARMAELLGDFEPIIYTGAESKEEHEEAVRAFQTDPAYRVFIGQNRACAEALTLTAASDTAHVEPDWNPTINYQAASRAHRMGQQDGVMSRFLFVPGTLDEAISRAIRRKTKEIAELFG